jgi:hypothetical protein
MPKRPPKPATQTKTQRSTLRTLSREIPSLDEFAQISHEVHHAHDRTAAILLVSQVERFLEIAIVSHLFHQDEATVKTLVNIGGPLSTFSAKIHLAYAMGFISEEAKYISPTRWAS